MPHTLPHRLDIYRPPVKRHATPLPSLLVAPNRLPRTASRHGLPVVVTVDA